MNPESDFQRVLREFSPLLDAYWPYAIGVVLGLITMIRTYMGGLECPSDDRIDGKTVIVTGASSGIGKETALELARRGGHVILAVRNVQAGNEVAEKIRAMPNGKADVKLLDLSSMKTVRSFAEELSVDKIDILINNAGITLHPYEISDEGFELHFATNYLGHFLLTHLLLPKLGEATQGRVINVSAEAHNAATVLDLDDLNLENKFTALRAFSQSKLALILMARHMSRVLKDTNITVNAVNPGRVRDTRHVRKSPINSTYIIKFFAKLWMWLLLKSPIQGAQSSIYAAVASQLEKCSGKYISDCEPKTPSNLAMDNELAESLYAKSLSLVKPYLLPERTIRSTEF